MARTRSAARPGGTPRVRSHAAAGNAGGPANVSGDLYQARAWGLIFLETLDQARDAVLRAQPRQVGDAEETAWDVGRDVVGESPESVEVKSSLSRAELVGVLANAMARWRSEPTAVVTIWYDPSPGGTTPLLEVLANAARRAGEAVDENEFVARLGRDGLTKGLQELGVPVDQPWELRAWLVRLRIRRMSNDDLEKHLQDGARRLLANPEKAGDYVDRLILDAMTSATGRRALSVLGLVKAHREAGFLVKSIPARGPENPALAGLRVLNVAPGGLPLSVIRAALGLSASESIDELLGPLEAEGTLVRSGDVLRGSGLPADPAPVAAAAAAFRALLTEIGSARQQHDHARAWRMVPSLVGLAEMLVASHPADVAGAFEPVHKLLKSMGDKHEVLRLSLAALDATNHMPDSEERAQHRARVLICGLSWSYQRFGELRQAQSYGDESLELGRRIGWTRNTSFCEKCLGRLARLRAEAAGDRTERARLFAESEDLLKQAIETFAADPSYGEDHPEVGDCYSLLGRTHLSSGRLEDARRAVVAALRLLPADYAEKDFCDAAILRAELTARLEGPARARTDFDQVVEALGRTDGREFSEILGRALIARGRNHRASGDQVAAESDLRQAGEIALRLGDGELALQARLAQLEDQAPEALRKRLEYKPLAVRVHALEDLTGRIANSTGVAFRGGSAASSIPSSAFDDIVRKAERSAAVGARSILPRARR